MPETIGEYTFDEFVEAARRFHGYPAPGLILGGFMVDEARNRLPEGTLFDAVSETGWCLPDAVQMLTLCTVGNGWLKIFNLGLYALTLYDKYTGEGWRVALDPGKLAGYDALQDWYLKRKPKKEQDSKLLRQQIREAGASVCSVRAVTIRPEYLEHRSKGRIAVCPICAEAYPAMDGGICRSCQGESPYAERLGSHPGRECPAERQAPEGPRLRTVAAEDAVGEAALHDMTRIEPGASKGAEFRKGQVLSVGDVCRLQQMGRFRVYVEDEEGPGEDWVHEDAAAKAFAAAMAGEGVAPEGPPREGKVNLVARRDGLLVVDEARLQRFNLLPDVMAASRQNHQTVEQGTRVAGTRAIPLYLHKGTFQSAQGLLEGGPLVRVLPLRRLRVGILVTGNEVFQGLIEDKFEPIITGKVRQYGCEVARTLVVPDDREAIRKGVNELMEAGAELIVTTAGLSVDPDDVTRQGLLDAGLVDALYGAPVLPGAMTLLGRVNGVRVMGVPACALYFKTTSFDLLLPRVLAGLEITRNDLAALATGGMCMECKTCTYPKCPFGK